MEPGISSAVVLPVLRALSDLGFTRALAPTGVIVGGSQADAVFDQAAAALGNDAIGIDVAKRVPMGALGELDYVLISSSTLRDGLARTAKYYGVVTQRVRLALIEEGHSATLVFERHPALSVGRHWIEFSFAMICERIRGTLGVPVAFTTVELKHAAPRDTGAHDEFFGVKVKFGSSRDAFSFDAGLLNAPLRTASSSLAEVLELKMKTLEPVGDDFMQRARVTVLSLLDRQDSSLQSVASKLAVSRRTLQRELQRRGTSHQALVDEVRRARARELLEEGFTVADVSEKLGFSEPSAFFRAFRRWTGHTPKAARSRASS